MNNFSQLNKPDMWNVPFECPLCDDTKYRPIQDKTGLVVFETNYDTSTDYANTAINAITKGELDNFAIPTFKGYKNLSNYNGLGGYDEWKLKRQNIEELRKNATYKLSSKRVRRFVNLMLGDGVSLRCLSCYPYGAGTCEPIVNFNFNDGLVMITPSIPEQLR